MSNQSFPSSVSGFADEVGSRMFRSTCRCAAITVGLLLIASRAMAGFSIDVYVDNIFFDTINDNDPQVDSNPVAGDILYLFELTDAQNRWEATGSLIAEGGYNGQPPVSTIVTDTLIEKIVDDQDILTGEIDFYHNYAASGPQTHMASIDGQFDNTIDHDVKGASLEYTADINGQNLGGYNTGLYAGPGPHVFNSNLGPLLLPTTTEHHMKLRFYLDSLGDSIEMFNSAEIHTVVPEPASSGLLLAALGAMLATRSFRLSSQPRSSRRTRSSD